MIRTAKKLFWGWAILLSEIGYRLIEAGKKVVQYE